MHTKNSIIHNSRETEIVEDLGAVLPYVQRAIFPQTLIIKTINLRDLSAFMVSSDQCDSIRVSDLLG